MQPFSSDGCSAFPNGTREESERWLACCIEHDKAYWQGGTEQQRVAADKKLQQCVAALDQEMVAAVMRVGVVIGGSPLWPSSFRWGYGWPYPRGYGELTAEEAAQAEDLLEGSQESKPEAVDE